jgi:hypothetical protein
MTSVNETVRQNNGQPNRVPVTVSSTSSLESYNPLLNLETESAIDAILSTPSGHYTFPDADFSMLPVANPLAPDGARTTRASARSGLCDNAVNNPPPQSTALHTILRTSVSGISLPFQSPSASSPPLQILAPITPLMTSTPAAATQPNNNTVAEFLYQLTKMLTDNNKETIEWTNGEHSLFASLIHRFL